MVIKKIEPPMRSFVLGLRAAGMANPQIVALTGVSLSTVKKLWTQAKDNGFVIDDVQLVADVSKLETALSPTKGSAIDNAPSKKRKAVSKKPAESEAADDGAQNDDPFVDCKSSGSDDGEN